MRILDGAVRLLQPDPGDERGPTAAAAQRTMAMRHPLAGQARREANVAAKAATNGWIHCTVPRWQVHSFLLPRCAGKRRALCRRRGFDTAVELAIADRLG